MISRMRLLLALMFTIMVIFTGRLMYLQFAMAEEFRALSTENFLEQRRIAPLRGRILARDGTVLADNRIAVDLMYWGGEIDFWDRISFMLDIQDEPREPDPGDPKERRYGTVLAWNIPDSLMPAIEELVAGQSSLYLRERIERTYPTNLAAQVVGYTTEADPQRFPGYELGDLLGQMGIEKSYQEALFGSPGRELVEVNNRRVVLSSREILPAQPGQDVILTIDPKLQRAAEDVLASALQYINAERKRQDLPADETVARGALVALNPKNGEILAMASQPSFDQNVFTRRPSSPEDIAALLNDNRNLPLLNRAVSEYPPASTFKPVTTSTLLEYNFVSPNTRFECSSSYRFLGITFRNWANYYRGNYNAAEAIADSCNTYYFRAAATTENVTKGWGQLAESLTNRALELGYGQPIGIGIAEEKAGRIPTDAWSRSFKGYPWRPGDTLNISIGQGDVLATPVQVAQFLATVALDGRQVQPHLIKQAGEQPVEVSEKQIPGRFWGSIKEGLRLMVTDYGGRSFLGSQSEFPIATAGKTGTAQNGKGPGYEHAWYMGYGPINDPELVVVVFIENGGSSTLVAIPTARDFMAAYWGVELP